MDDISLKDLIQLILQQAKEKGFGSLPEEVYIPEKIALIHDDISKAYEAYRHKKMTGEKSFANELGDAAQRIFHIAAVMGIDLEGVILEKIKKNKDKAWNWQELNENHG